MRKKPPPNVTRMRAAPKPSGCSPRVSTSTLSWSTCSRSRSKASTIRRRVNYIFRTVAPCPTTAWSWPKNPGGAAQPGVCDNPPVSTQQIHHQALYRSGKPPAAIALPRLEKLLGNNWTKLDENVMGEFGWKEVLKQFLDNDRAKAMAAAWDGDRYAVFEQKQTKKLILVTHLHLDSEERAARLFGQYSEALEKKYAPR